MTFIWFRWLPCARSRILSLILSPIFTTNLLRGCLELEHLRHKTTLFEPQATFMMI